MIEEVILLGYRAYSFADQESGQLVEGITVWVLPTFKEDDSKVVGYFPCKYNLPLNELDNLIGSYPCYAKAVFKINLATKKITLNTFKDLRPCNFN